MNQKAFTIVELLIVIVVIAILAAITTVAFTGIQTRANNNQTIVAAKEIIKAFNAYTIDNGAYPSASGCIGTGYPAPNNRCLSQSGVAECFGMGAATSTVLNDALKPYMGNKVPAMSPQQVACGATTYMGGYASYNATTREMGVWIVLRGDIVCPTMSPNVASSSKGFSGDVSLCRYNLAAV